MAWKFTHDDHVYDEEDVTLEQWGRIRLLTARLAAPDADKPPPPKMWQLVNPAFDSFDATAIFAVLIGDQQGLASDAAVKLAGQFTIRDLTAKFHASDEDSTPTEYENGLPKEEGDPTTSGSSGAPSDTGGPPTS